MGGVLSGDDDAIGVIVGRRGDNSEGWVEEEVEDKGRGTGRGERVWSLTDVANFGTFVLRVSGLYFLLPTTEAFDVDVFLGACVWLCVFVLLVWWEIGEEWCVCERERERRTKSGDVEV